MTSGVWLPEGPSLCGDTVAHGSFWDSVKPRVHLILPGELQLVPSPVWQIKSHLYFKGGAFKMAINPLAFNLLSNKGGVNASASCLICAVSFTS